MKSLLHTLADNESVLLMYLSDELPADDRLEVEAMLATDAGLRARLEALRETFDVTNDLLAAADRDAGKRGAVRSAIRQASKTIDIWNVRRTLDRPAPPLRSRTAKWIGYPIGAAAAILLVWLIFWGISNQPTGTPIIAGGEIEMTDQQREIWAQLQAAWGEPEPEDVSLSDAGPHQHLYDAERQIGTLAQLGETDTIGDDLFH